MYHAPAHNHQLLMEVYPPHCRTAAVISQHHRNRQCLAPMPATGHL